MKPLFKILCTKCRTKFHPSTIREFYNCPKCKGVIVTGESVENEK